MKHSETIPSPDGARRSENSGLQGVVRYGYVPLMVLGFNGLALLAIAHHLSWLLPAMLLCAVVLSFIAERVLPYRAEWNRSHGDGRRDTLHALVNELANSMSVIALPVVAGLIQVTDAWPRELPFPLQVLIAVLVFDAGITMTHWLSHRVTWLWRFHAVHHSVKRMYGFNGLMKHPVHQAIEMTGGVLPLVLLGLSLEVGMALAFATAMQLLLQHSNVDYRVGPIAGILALNEGHRFHHLRWPGLGDVNFGLFTLLWDRILGTYRLDPRRFTSEDLGIAAAPNYPVGYLPQLAEPFRSLDHK